MAIIDSYNRKRGVIYVYDSFSYWDKELGQPRSKRRLLGRRDPDTSEVIPTRKRKEKPAVTLADSDSGPDYATLYRRSQENIRKKDALIQRLRRELAEARHCLAEQDKGIARAVETLNDLRQSGEQSHA